MSTFIIWFIFIGFSIAGYYQFKWTVIFYLAIKVVLIKPILLFYIDGFPLATLDRAMEFVLIFYLFIPRNKGWTQCGNFQRNPFFWSWTLLIIAQVLLFIAHLSDFANASKGLLLFVFEYFLLYVLVVFSLKHRKDLKILFVSFGGVFLLVGIYGLLTKWTGQNLFIDFFAQKAKEIGNENLVFTYGNEIRFGIAGRVQSVVFHAIAYGGILAMFIPVFTVQFLRSDRLSKKFYWYALSCILVVNLFFANSRAAILSCGIVSLSVVYVFVEEKKKILNAIFLLTPFVAAALMLFVIPDPGQLLKEAYHGINEGGELKGSTLADRFGKFYYAFNEVSNKLFFGKGFGHVAQLIHMNDAGIGGAESFWLRQIIEAGIVGVLGYVLFFAGICQGAIKQFIRTKRFEWLFLISLTLGYLVFISLTGELNTFPFFVVLLAVFSNLAASFKTANE